jgi:hypothetical protein
MFSGMRDLQLNLNNQRMMVNNSNNLFAPVNYPTQKPEII